MGPVVSKEAFERINLLIGSGINEGADLVLDGRDITLQGYENGYFIGPCLFDRVNDKMKIYKEEIFGPVLSVVRKNTYEDLCTCVFIHFVHQL